MQLVHLLRMCWVQLPPHTNWDLRCSSVVHHTVQLPLLVQTVQLRASAHHSHMTGCCGCWCCLLVQKQQQLCAKARVTELTPVRTLASLLPFHT